MKRNMGFIDRIIRLALVAVVAGLYWQGYISGLLAIILGAIAVIFLVTSLLGFCPLYLPFKFSTKKE